MKKLSILFLSFVAMTMSVTSCSDDDNPSNPPVSEAVVGKWTYDKFTYTKAGTTTTETEYNEAACLPKVNILDIKTAGVLQETVISPSDDPDTPCAATPYDGTWTLDSSNVMTITEGTATFKYTVVSVTSSLLTVKYINPADPGEYLTIKLKK